MVMQIEDVKVRRSFSVSLVEDTLTRRPFNKHLLIQLLDEQKPLRDSEGAGSWFDLAKLARECLKSFTSEDLRMIYSKYSYQM